MVNQTILNYLSQNRNFPLFELKNRILSSGYNEFEFYEAANLLGLGNIIKPKKRGFKWMLIAGVIGIVLFLSIIWTIYGVSNLLVNGIPIDYLNPNINSNQITTQNSTNLDLTYLAIFLGICLIIILFYFGFERMARNTQTTTLRVISWVFIILTTLFAFLFLSVYLFPQILSNVVSDLLGTLINLFTETGTNPTNFWIIPAMIGILTIILIITFGTGLILVKRVKFTRISGILQIAIVITTIAIAFKIYSDIKNPDFIMSVFFSLMDPTGESIKEIIKPYLIMILGNQVIAAATLLFQSLSLFNASKRFE